jgi:uncharacterized membrane protein YfcA
VLLLGYLLALVIGVTLGVLGGGGSILTVPVFVYVLGYDPKLAIAMSLPVVGATSLVGAFAHWRAGNLHLRTALIFGAVAMCGAFIAARLSARLSGRTQLFVLGVAMLTSAVLMMRGSRGAPTPAGETTVRHPLAAPFLLSGLFVGALTGVVGIGGGFLIVPALVVLARVPMRPAVGTSLTVIAMNAAAGFAGQPRVGEIPLGVLVVFSGIAISGVIAGTWIARHVHQGTLKRAFAALLLVVAASLLWQNRALW